MKVTRLGAGRRPKITALETNVENVIIKSSREVRVHGRILWLNSYFSKTQVTFHDVIQVGHLGYTVDPKTVYFTCKKFISYFG